MMDVLTRRRFSVEEYYRMGETGILSQGERVELIAGEIVMMTPIGPPHAGSVDRLTRLWTSRLGDRVIVRVQNPVRFPPDTELQPDVALLRPRADFYGKSHPECADVLLLIEVADTTAETDRGVKIPLYAKAGIREVWLLDLSVERVEVYRQPSPDGYREVLTYHRGQVLAPETFSDLLLSLDDLLG
jgi:Uma2 family endonuclease